MADTDTENEDFGGEGPKKRKRRKFRLFRSKKKPSDADLFADSDDDDDANGAPSGRDRTQTETTAESGLSGASTSSRSRSRRGFSFFKRSNSKSSLGVSESEDAKSEGYTTEEDKRSVGSSRRKRRSFVPKLFRSRSRKRRDLGFDSSDDEDDAAQEKDAAGKRASTRREVSASESIPVPLKGREKYTDEEMKQVEKDLKEPESEEERLEKEKREEVRRKEEEIKRKEEEMKAKEEEVKREAERRREEMKKKEEELKKQEEEMKKRLEEEAEKRKQRAEELEKKKKEAEERRKQLQQPPPPKPGARPKKGKKKSKLAAFLAGGSTSDDDDEEPEEEPEEGEGKSRRRGRKYVQDLPEFEEEDVRLTEDSIFSASDDERDVKNDLSHTNYGNYLHRNNKDPSKRTLVKKRRRSKRRRSKRRDKPKVEKEARFSLLDGGVDGRDDEVKERKSRGGRRDEADEDEGEDAGYSSSEELKNVGKDGAFGHQEMKKARAELERKRDKLLEDKRRQDDTLEEEVRIDDEERKAEAEIEQLRAEVLKLEQEEDERDQLKKSLRAVPSTKSSKRRSKQRSKRRRSKREEVNVAPLLNYTRTRLNEGVVFGLVEDFLNFWAKPYFIFEWATLVAISGLVAARSLKDQDSAQRHVAQAAYIGLQGALLLLSDEEPAAMIGVMVASGGSGAAVALQLKNSSSGFPNTPAAGLIEGMICGLFGYLIIRGVYDVQPLNRLVAFLVSCLCIATATLNTSLVEPNPVSVVGMVCGSLVALLASKDNYNTAVRYYSSLALIE